MTTIFSDGFESGDVSAWTGQNGTPVVSGDSKLVGAYGLEVDAVDDYVYQAFTEVTRLRVRVWIDPHSFTMAAGEKAHFLFIYDGAVLVGYVRLQFTTVYRLDAGVLNDASAWKGTAAYTITDGPHWAEVDFSFANTVGSMTLYIDGILEQMYSSIDLGTRAPDSVRLGWLQAVGSPSGTLYLDHLEMNDDGDTIGPGITPPMAMCHYRRRRSLCF